MTKLAATIFLLLLMGMTMSAAYATWSVIIVDPKTKQVGIAGASCTQSVYGIGGIIPGKGAVIVQAMSNRAARNKGLEMMLADASPEEILKAIRDPEFDPEQQQYALVCLNAPNKPQTYTGTATNDARGAVTANGISVQGNTLVNTEMLDKVLEAIIKAQEAALPMEEILMLALEAGAEYGGDKRCGNLKASSAFITLAKPGDDRQRPYMNLVVTQLDEPSNAIRRLRNKFNAWKSSNQ